jgi:predicted MFS family arabinose efflux permease
MNRHEKLIEFATAAMTGAVLVAVPLAGWLYRGSLGWRDAIVALVGIAALVLAGAHFLRWRELGRALQNAATQS